MGILAAIVAGLTVIIGLIKLITYLVQTSRQRTYIKLKGQETELLNEIRKAAAASNGALVGQLERELVLLRQKIALYTDAKRVPARNKQGHSIQSAPRPKARGRRLRR